MDSRGLFSLKFAAAHFLAACAACGWALFGPRRHAEVAPETLVASGETAGSIILRFNPSEIDRPRELVRFAGSAAGIGEHLFAQRGRSGAIELGYALTADAAPILSPALPRRAGTVELHVSISSLYPASGFRSWKSWLLVRADGAPFWEVPIDGRALPNSEPIVGDGVAIEMPPGYSASSMPPLDRSRVRGARVLLRLAPTMMGRSFPLVETGIAGRSDLVFFHVAPGPALIFGYCHAGDRPLLSAPFPARFQTAFDVAFAVPSLMGAHPGPLSIAVGARPVWIRTVPCYRPGPDEVAFGANPLRIPEVEAAIVGARFEGVLDPTWTGG